MKFQTETLPLTHSLSQAYAQAADVIAKTAVKGEAAAIAMNKQVAQDVRQTMRARGATMPENLPIEPPIAEVKKRLKKQTADAIKAAKADPSNVKLPPS